MELIKHPEFGEIRTVMRQGEPWFAAQDVCDILGIQRQKDSVVKNLDDDERGAVKIPTLGGHQNMVIINESGLYTLLLRSNKPAAKKFRKWVTSEVLPSIRRQGFYFHPDFMGKKEMKLLQRQVADNLKRYLPEEDIRKIAKKHGTDRYRVLSIIDGTTINNPIMQECQNRALSNKAQEVNAYHPNRMRDIIEKLSR